MSDECRSQQQLTRDRRETGSGLGGLSKQVGRNNCIVGLRDAHIKVLFAHGQTKRRKATGLAERDVVRC